MGEGLMVVHAQSRFRQRRDGTFFISKLPAFYIPYLPLPVCSFPAIYTAVIFKKQF